MIDAPIARSRSFQTVLVLLFIHSRVSATLSLAALFIHSFITR